MNGKARRENEFNRAQARIGLREVGYTDEQIDQIQREASEEAKVWAKEAVARMREAYPDGDNHLCGFITPWGSTHRMVRTESGEWTAVRNEPVNFEDRQKMDRWLEQRLLNTAQDQQ